MKIHSILYMIREIQIKTEMDYLLVFIYETDKYKQRLKYHHKKGYREKAIFINHSKGGSTYSHILRHSH